MNNLFDNLQFKVYTDILKKSKKDGKRLIRGYASTAALDRQNEVITIGALREAANHLLENHTVFYEHEHQKFPVGKVIETGIDDKGLRVVVEISKTADQLWTLIEEDILDSFSIGGRVVSSEEKVGKDGKKYTEVTGIELFEVSVVGLPANPEAKFKLVNKSFNMAITDEIKKRKEEKEVDKEKIEATTTTTDIASDGTSNIEKNTEQKVEEKKVVEESIKEKKDIEIVEKKDAQKDDLEKYEKEDKEASEKEKVEDAKAEDTSKIQINLLPDKTEGAKDEKVEDKPELVEERKEEPKVEKEEEKIEADDEEGWEKLIDEVEDAAKEYPYPYYPYPYYGYPYPYPAFLEQTGEIMFLLDKLIAGEKDEKRKASLQEIKAKISKLQGGKYPYPEEYPYPRAKSNAAEKEIRYPYPRLSEEVQEIVFLLDKLIETETNEDAKATLQEIKAKVLKLVGQAYPYPEKYPYPKEGEAGKQYPYPYYRYPYPYGYPYPYYGYPYPYRYPYPRKEKEAGKQYPAPEDTLKEILAGIKDLGKKIDDVLERLPGKDVEVKEPEEKKEEPKIEKKVNKEEEKPKRKSFIADPPYAPNKNDEEKEEKDTKKTTDKGWSKLVYGK